MCDVSLPLMFRCVCLNTLKRTSVLVFGERLAASGWMDVLLRSGPKIPPCESVLVQK